MVGKDPPNIPADILRGSMTVSFSHGSAAWPSYTAFHTFRRRLAREIGCELDEMSGFYGQRSWVLVRDTVEPFLSASDQGGEISAARCPGVADRIRELTRLWPDEDADRPRALELARGLERAGRRGETFRLGPAPP